MVLYQIYEFLSYGAKKVLNWCDAVNEIYLRFFSVARYVAESCVQFVLFLPSASILVFPDLRHWVQSVSIFSSGLVT